MSSDYGVCTRSYATTAFDRWDSNAGRSIRHSMHGPVKVWTKKEIKEYNKKLEAQSG